MRKVDGGAVLVEDGVHAAQERISQEVRLLVGRVGAERASAAVLELPDELAQGYVDGEVVKREIDGAFEAAGDNVQASGFAVLGTNVDGEALDDGAREVGEGGAGVEEDIEGGAFVHLFGAN